MGLYIEDVDTDDRITEARFGVLHIGLVRIWGGVSDSTGGVVSFEFVDWYV
jgi:hypothetical protein